MQYSDTWCAEDSFSTMATQKHGKNYLFYSSNSKKHLCAEWNKLLAIQSMTCIFCIFCVLQSIFCVIFSLFKELKDRIGLNSSAIHNFRIPPPSSGGFNSKENNSFNCFHSQMPPFAVISALKSASPVLSYFFN